MRFVLHLLIVSVLGPALAGAVFTFVGAHWNEASLFVRTVGSVVGGFVLLLFIAPIVLPVGVVSYCVFAVAQHKTVVAPTWLWSAVCAVLGMIYGLYWAACFVHGFVPLFCTTGGIIGALSGAILAVIWKKR